MRYLFLLLLPVIGLAQTFPTPPEWDGTDLRIATDEVYLTIKRIPDGDGTAYVFAVVTRGAVEVQDIFANAGGTKLSFVLAELADPPLGNRNFVGVYPVGAPGEAMLVEIQSPSTE